MAGLRTPIAMLAFGALAAYAAPESVGEPFKVPEAKRPSVSATAPPPPLPAPFPYRYGGQARLEDGAREVYLTKGNDLLLVKAGDVLDAVFKIVAVREDDLEVLHMPSNVATRLELYASLESDVAVALEGAKPPGMPVGVSGPTPGSLDFAPATTSAPATAATEGGRDAIAGFTDSGSQAIVGGEVPTGQLGSLDPAAGTMPLGVEPTAAGSMPMLPAPAGVMRTLPPPSGRLGI